MKPGLVGSLVTNEDDTQKKLVFSISVTEPRNALSIILAYDF